MFQGDGLYHSNDDLRAVLLGQLWLLFIRALRGLPVTVGALLRLAFLVQQIEGDRG
jgi:hypothetical protein